MTTKSMIFTTDDFLVTKAMFPVDIREICTGIANRKIESLIGIQMYLRDTTWSPIKYFGSTHTAWIFDMKEIKKEKCNHEVIHYRGKYPPSDAKCGKCGVKLYLKAEWLEAEVK